MLEYRMLPADGTSKENGDPISTFLGLAGLNAASQTGPPVQEGRLSLNTKLDGSIPASVEFDFEGSRLTHARVIPPWTKPESLSPIKILQPGDFSGILILIMILSSIPLAVRNLRTGRGDRQGALRVGLLVFGCFFLGVILYGHHELNTTYEMTVLIETASLSLYRGVTAALFYLALEPFVRRVWPESLVSWTRLLFGNWRDPMVARDILIGTMATCILYGLWGLATMLSNHTELFVMKKNLQALFGLTQCAATTAIAVSQSMRVGLMFLLLLLLLRVFSRIRWVAPFGLFLIVAGFMTSILVADSGIGFVAMALAILWGVVVVLILARFGLLAVITVIFFGMLGGFLPDAARLTEWSSFCLKWQVGLAVLVSLYGLYFATGRKPFGEAKLFEA
jgi:serine/threonine-protein kinase